MIRPIPSSNPDFPVADLQDYANILIFILTHQNLEYQNTLFSCPCTLKNNEFFNSFQKTKFLDFINVRLLQQYFCYSIVTETKITNSRPTAVTKMVVIKLIIINLPRK